MNSNNSQTRIIYIAQGHWIYAYAPAILFLFIALIPYFFLPLYHLMNNFLAGTIGPTFPVQKLNVLFSLLWTLLNITLWIVFFRRLTEHYLDAWIITEEEVIDIDFIGFFKREQAVIRYENIEDMKVNVSGFFKTMIDTGDITIQSAAEHREFTFKNVAYPYYVKSVIESIIRSKIGFPIQNLSLL